MKEKRITIEKKDKPRLKKHKNIKKLEKQHSEKNYHDSKKKKTKMFQKDNKCKYLITPKTK